MRIEQALRRFLHVVRIFFAQTRNCLYNALRNVSRIVSQGDSKANVGNS